MDKVIAQPTQEMLVLCDDIDTQIQSFLDARNAAPATREFESQAEAVCLFNLALRQIEGVIALGRKDVVLLPAAIVAARAAFESAVKAAWLVDRDDPMDCEARWLVHLESEERFLNRSAASLSKAGVSAESLLERAAQLRNFRKAVDRAMPAGVVRVKGTPNFKDMLESIGGTFLYGHYIETCQYVHAEHAATWLYRRGGMGTAKELGEFVEPKHWWLPLRIAWLTLTRPAELFLARIGAPQDLVAKLNRNQKLESLLSSPSVQESRSVH